MEANVEYMVSACARTALSGQPTHFLEKAKAFDGLLLAACYLGLEFHNVVCFVG